MLTTRNDFDLDVRLYVVAEGGSPDPLHPPTHHQATCDAGTCAPTCAETCAETCAHTCSHCGGGTGGHPTRVGCGPDTSTCPHNCGPPPHLGN